MKKCIVTVLGKDTVGIVAKVCTYLAENKINVLDISQTIIQGYFNMMVIVDVTELPKDFTCLLYTSIYEEQFRPSGLKYLGFGFCFDTRAHQFKAKSHAKSVVKFKRRMKVLTCRRD